MHSKISKYICIFVPQKSEVFIASEDVKNLQIQILLIYENISLY